MSVGAFVFCNFALDCYFSEVGGYLADSFIVWNAWAELLSYYVLLLGLVNAL